jgi:hypothetical protein
MTVLEKLENGAELVELLTEELDQLLEFVDFQVDESFKTSFSKTKAKSASKNAKL